MSGRKAISKTTRFEVFKRDGFACAYCGASPPDVLLEADHIHPVAEGGTNEMDNLVTACVDCNRGKGARLLSTVPQSLEDKAAATQEREDQLRAYYEVMEAKREREEDDLWTVAEIFMDRFADDSITTARLTSIKTFLRKLDVFEVREAMDIAAHRFYSKPKAFSYFCGICWNKIKRAEEGE